VTEQVAPFKHGLVEHAILVEQSTPEYGYIQVHLHDEVNDEQTPLFKHGELKQKSILMSHLVPVQPAGQIQLNPFKEGTQVA